LDRLVRFVRLVGLVRLVSLIRLVSLVTLVRLVRLGQVWNRLGEVDYVSFVKVHNTTNHLQFFSPGLYCGTCLEVKSSFKSNYRECRFRDCRCILAGLGKILFLIPIHQPTLADADEGHPNDLVLLLS
jgi:hypothetical protein